MRFLERFSEIHPTDARSRLRHVALSGLGAAYELSGRMERFLARDRAHFLCFHYVYPDQEEAFRKLLVEVGKTHSFISYSEAVARVRENRIDGRYVCVSFDDGLATCLTAARILRELGLSACFFVCPSIIGEEDEGKLAAFSRDRLRMPPSRYLSRNDLECMKRDGHEFGSHTMSHRNLAQLSESEIREELESSRQALEQWLGAAEHFAWPYGRFHEFSPMGARIVQEVGYVSCASAERGCHVPGRRWNLAELCLRRESLVATWPLSHVRYFLARSSRSRWQWLARYLGYGFSRLTTCAHRGRR